MASVPVPAALPAAGSAALCLVAGRRQEAAGGPCRAREGQAGTEQGLPKTWPRQRSPEVPSARNYSVASRIVCLAGTCSSGNSVARGKCAAWSGLVPAERAARGLFRPVAALVTSNSSKCLTCAARGTVTAESRGGCSTLVPRGFLPLSLLAMSQAAVKGLLFRLSLWKSFLLLFSCQEARVSASPPPDKGRQLPACPTCPSARSAGRAACPAGS